MPTDFSFWSLNHAFCLVLAPEYVPEMLTEKNVYDEGIKLYRRVATLKQFEGYMLLLLFAVYTITTHSNFTTPRKPQPLQLQHCPIITCSQTAKTKNIYMNGLPSSFHEFMRPKKVS
jgi:hypothetical protein